MNVTLNDNEVLIIKAALTRINNDNRSRGCAVTQDFEDLLIKIEAAARSCQPST
ncbi:hypothetical protein [Paenirhodobacter populi]|uniref:hypothetical protein n=1 Tax=Paenirhodobacter populi TaxID=2306993 RepID=UPI0013E2C09E|nr:hypothetical protein [Sinirhodobacter populi]